MRFLSSIYLTAIVTDGAAAQRRVMVACDLDLMGDGGHVFGKNRSKGIFIFISNDFETPFISPLFTLQTP